MAGGGKGPWRIPVLTFFAMKFRSVLGRLLFGGEPFQFNRLQPPGDAQLTGHFNDKGPRVNAAVLQSVYRPRNLEPRTPRARISPGERGGFAV